MTHLTKHTHFLFILLLSLILNCATTGSIAEIKEKIKIDTDDFLIIDKNAKEVFRVLLSSDKYTVKQMKYLKHINKSKDPGGDKYISSELIKHNKINEAREGIITVWLFPDTGKIMKIRPQKPTYIIEIDKLITEDIQRWNFDFPKKYISPTKFNIRYRVVLRKKLSDEEIIREVRKKISGD